MHEYTCLWAGPAHCLKEQKDTFSFIWHQAAVVFMSGENPFLPDAHTQPGTMLFIFSK